MEQIHTHYQNYLLSSDKTLLDTDAIYHYLAVESYWSKNIPRPLLQNALDHSFCIGIYLNGKQAGFGRLITDYATFAYLADVFVLPEHRGKGLSKAMMEAVTGLQWIKGLRRFMLATLDAHGLYSQYGFAPSMHPERLMEIVRPGIYNDPAGTATQG